MYDIIVIGAGCSGLCAAVNALLLKPDINVLLLEKQDKCGRKLSASGNGKCNVTNSDWNEECYHSSDNTFSKEFINNHSFNDVIDFFDKCGLPLYENDGYYYPLSNQAKQVTSKLLNICLGFGVDIKYSQEVKEIKLDKTYTVKASDNNYESTYVIIATGSNAWDKLGGTDSGYKLALGLNLDMIKRYPGLSPIYVDDRDLKTAKGVRLNGIASLHINELVVKETGQIQINEDNLSGISIMNLSNYLSTFNPEDYKDCLWLDIMPSFSWDELRSYIDGQCKSFPDETVVRLLEGLFPHDFVIYLLRRINIDTKILISELSDKQKNKITSNIKKLTFTPKSNDRYDKAQVTLGGVSIEDINRSSFESIRYPNMYLIGEILDMTGKCGGYNISFAVLSALNASRDIVSKIK